MAKDNVRMPSSTAGITSFQEEYSSRIKIQPGHVIVIAIIVVIVIAALHVWGSGLLGI